MPQLQFPLLLLLLIAIPVVLWFTYRTSAGLPRWGRIALMITRACLAALLVFAVASPFINFTAKPDSPAILLDRSASSADGTDAKTVAANAIDAFEKPSLFSFAAETTKPNIVGFGEVVDDEATNISAAIASGQSHSDTTVIVSDGRENTGDALAVAQLSPRPIHAMKSVAFSEGEIAVSRLITPNTVGRSEDFFATVNIHAMKGGPATLLYGGKPEVREVELKKGENEFVFRDNLSKSKHSRATSPNCPVIVTPKGSPEDLISVNNNRYATVQRSGDPRVLIVSGNDENEEVSDWHRSIAEVSSVQSLTLKEFVDLPLADITNEQYELIVLLNVPSNELDAESSAKINDFVNSGGGLLTIGGETTFGREVLAGSTLEPILPVTAAPTATVKETVSAMVLVIDQSLSMLEDDRLSLAKAGAKEVVNILGPEDKVGLLAFGDTSRWVSDLAPCENKPQVIARIEALEAGGRTNMFPALQRAQLALEQTIADEKHMIILTDGVSTPGEFTRLAKELAKAKIGVSTVSVGAGADQTILKDIAELAGGRHRHCDQASDLDDIVVAAASEAVQAKGSSEFTPFMLRILPGLPTESLPKLGNFVRTAPKQDAERLMLAPAGAPLLSWRRQGKGIVTAFTADPLAADAAAFREWSGSDKFWSKVVAHTIGERTEGILVEVSSESGSIRMRVVGDAEDQAFTDRQYRFEATRIMKFVVTTNFAGDLTQVAPGIFSGELLAMAQTPYQVTVIETPHDENSNEIGHEFKREVIAKYSREYELGGDDSTLQSAVALSGGEMVTELAAVKSLVESTSGPKQRKSVWVMFAFAGMLLLLVDAFCQRAAMMFA